VPEQVAQTVSSQAKQVPELKYFPVSHESHIPVVRQVLQSALQETLQFVAVPEQVAQTELSQT
jgi:hypothetical protein